MKEKIWIIEDISRTGKNYGYFSSKLKAINALDLWSNSASFSYTVDSPLLKDVDLHDGNGVIFYITVKFDGKEKSKILFLRPSVIDNGCDLIYLKP